jgi:hypothetical protein
MKSMCPLETFQRDMIRDSTTSHGLITYDFKAKHCSSNAATWNMKSSQTLSKNIKCATTRLQLQQHWNVDPHILMYICGEEVVP